MAEALCYRDAYAREVETTVLAVQPGLDGTGSVVTLAETPFYPGGGGQPADRGWLRAVAADDAGEIRVWTVVSARKSGGGIVHELEPGVDPPALAEAVLAE